MAFCVARQGKLSKRIGMEIQKAIRMVFLWKVGITGCVQYHHDQSFTPIFETGNPERNCLLGTGEWDSGAFCRAMQADTSTESH
ncbi:hypothetical protein AD928_00815 [Acetobacter cerevisiae]|uniref:Uncharacterized protein n=1 Tax=Acetobacter cerevisiae TaxID=178900 RepID=A0A149QZE4_9PROT|nr:hypothetical protein AD928_00815 [Acetobacter cerevisiae]